MLAKLHKILVIDDEPEILELVSFNLRREGYRVVSSNNGLEGLELAFREKPDLALLDIILPDLNGFEILKGMKLHVQARRTPVVMLTARCEEVDRLLGFDAAGIGPHFQRRHTDN